MITYAPVKGSGRSVVGVSNELAELNEIMTMRF